MIKMVVNKSGAGKIVIIYSICDNPTPGTWGSYQLMLEEFKRSDEDWQMGGNGEPNGKFKQLQFNTQFLEYIQNKYGELHCEYCGKAHLKIIHWKDKPQLNVMATADHFLPKKGNKTFSFNRQNLVVSCYRCNNKLKRDHEWPIISLRYYYPKQKLWRYAHESLWVPGKRH